MWGAIWKVISCAPHVRTFPLYTFHMLSCVDVRWHLKSHLASTLRENFGVLGHARWMWGEIWKVISHAPHMRTFPLYTFQMLSTSRENFGVVEGTLGHARWTQGEILKVISCAPHMRTLVWWRGHLVMLDRWTRGEILKVISCAPCMRTLVWWRGHLVMLDGCKVMFEK